MSPLQWAVFADALVALAGRVKTLFSKQGPARSEPQPTPELQRRIAVGTASGESARQEGLRAPRLTRARDVARGAASAALARWSLGIGSQAEPVGSLPPIPQPPANHPPSTAEDVRESKTHALPTLSQSTALQPPEEPPKTHPSLE